MSKNQEEREGRGYLVRRAAAGASALVIGLGLGGGQGDALASVSSHEGNIAPNPNFIFDGGTADQKAKITRAINECNFNWDVLPQKVTIHFASVASGAEASPGEIWINPVLMDPKDPNDHFVDGTFQHEAMHQVDFMLLDDKDRKKFAGKFRLKIKAWTRDENPNLRHEDYGEELFADALSVACWPSKYNILSGTSDTSDENKAMPPPKKAMALLTLILRAKGLNAQKQPQPAQPLQVRHKINSDPTSN